AATPTISIPWPLRPAATGGLTRAPRHSSYPATVKGGFPDVRRTRSGAPEGVGQTDRGGAQDAGAEAPDRRTLFGREPRLADGYRAGFGSRDRLWHRIRARCSPGNAAHPSGAVHIAGLRGRGEDDASHRAGVPGE